MNRRMRQLVLMFADITGKSKDESERIIRETATGKAILAEDETVIYEQQTENLYCIAQELKEIGNQEDVVVRLSNENIIKAMKKLHELEKNNRVGLTYSKPTNVSIKSNDLLKKQNQVLRIKRQNKANVRRIENVN